jgi:hypothetical protein
MPLLGAFHDRRLRIQYVHKTASHFAERHKRVSRYMFQRGSYSAEKETLNGGLQC